MKTINEKLEYIYPYVSDILKYDKYMKLKEFNHHWEYSIFDHCVSVAYNSCRVARFLRLDYVSTARGGMLHDFFLYNWKTYKPKEGVHGRVHPMIAYRNSIEKFELNDKEKDIIIKHMFPLTLKPPKYFESMLVCIVDTLCAIKETLDALYITMKVKLIKGKKRILVPQFIYSFLYIFLIRSL